MAAVTKEAKRERLKMLKEVMKVPTSDKHRSRSVLGTKRICPDEKCEFTDCPHQKKHTHTHICIRDRSESCPSCVIYYDAIFDAIQGRL